MAQRSRRPQRKTYGNVCVKGRGRLQQGDLQIVNNYYVKTDDLIDIIHSMLADSNANNLAKRSKESSVHAREDPQTTSDGPQHNGKANLRKKGEGDENRVRVRHCANSAIRSSTVKLIQILYEFVPTNLIFQKLSKIIPRAPQTCSNENVANPPSDPYEKSEDVLVTHTSGHTKALRDFSLILAAALSCLLGRNMTAHEYAALLTRCKHDQMLPLLTFALGIGLYRLFTAQAVLSAPIQHFVTLEDAYARTVDISMDILVDFSILNSFLKVHYNKTNSAIGERLIGSGQYHIMLETRRGMVLGRVNWTAVAKRIKPGSRLINSVCLDSIDAACFGCRATLAVSVLGDFYCSKCNVSYRDDAALQAQLWASTTAALKPYSDDNKSRSVGTPHPLSRAEMDTERVNVNCLSAEHDIGGLRHLDLRIVPPTPGPGLDKTAKNIPGYIPSDSSHVGTVKWFNVSTGFGCILPSDGGKEILVHFIAIRMNVLRKLYPGQSITFEIVQGLKGMQASNVHISQVFATGTDKVESTWSATASSPSFRKNLGESLTEPRSHKPISPPLPVCSNTNCGRIFLKTSDVLVENCPCGYGYYDSEKQEFVPGSLVRAGKRPTREEYVKHVRECRQRMEGSLNVSTIFHSAHKREKSVASRSEARYTSLSEG